MPILDLNFSRVQKKHKDRTRTYLMSLVECEECGTQRLIYKLHAVKGRGISFCNKCIHHQEYVTEKIRVANLSFWKDKPKNNNFALLKNRCRSAIHRGINNLANTSGLVGYSGIELRKHIESFWAFHGYWMNWDNYGNSSKEWRKRWNIDHIKPISVFFKEGCTDLKIINSLDNLRPMDSRENMFKSDKWKVTHI